MGRFDEAIAAIETCRRQMSGAPLSVYPLAFALMGAGREDDAKRLARELTDASRAQYVKPWFLAMVHVAIGQIDTAFEYFEQSFAERDGWTIWFGTDPKLRALHRHPRFMALLRSMSPTMADKIALSVHSS